MRFLLSRARSVAAAALLGALVMAIPTGVARADEFVDRLNTPLARIPAAKRSDLVLLPLMAKMTDPPNSLSTRDEGRELYLLAPGQSAFEAASTWAQAPEQKAVLEALSKVTEDDHPETRMVWAIPYGVEGAEPDLVEAGMYIDLGDPPLLAAAKIGYENRLAWVLVLGFVEAQRLAGEGKPAEGIEVLLDIIGFGRQLADRALYQERTLGEAMMLMGLIGVRDIAYLDSKASTHTLTPDGLKEVITKLNDRRTTVGMDRLLFPTGARVAYEQLLTRIYTPEGTADPETFATTLSGLSSATRPLRLFSEAARWDRVRAVAPPLAETQRALSNMFSDWERRWSLQIRDPILSSATDYTKTVQGKPSMAILEMSANLESLFNTRRMLMTEVAGTRMALGMYAQFLRHGSYPLALTAIRPEFVQAIDTDPFDSGARSLRFFVPIRDTKDVEKRSQPLEMRVFPTRPFKPFSITLRDDVFVLYSVGPDDENGFAKNIMQADSGGDYLLWPPVASLLRQSLIDLGELE